MPHSLAHLQGFLGDPRDGKARFGMGFPAPHLPGGGDPHEDDEDPENRGRTPVAPLRLVPGASAQSQQEPRGALELSRVPLPEKPEYNEKRAKQLQYATLAALIGGGLGYAFDSPLATTMFSGVGQGYAGALQGMNETHQARLGTYYDTLFDTREYNTDVRNENIRRRQEVADDERDHEQDLAAEAQDAEQALAELEAEYAAKRAFEKYRRGLPLTEEEQASLAEIQSRILENQAQAESARALAEKRRSEAAGEVDGQAVFTRAEIEREIGRVQEILADGEIEPQRYGPPVRVPLSVGDRADATEYLRKLKLRLRNHPISEGEAEAFDSALGRGAGYPLIDAFTPTGFKITRSRRDQIRAIVKAADSGEMSREEANARLRQLGVR